MRKRAQLSLEFLAVSSFSIFILMTFIYFIFHGVEDSRDAARLNSAHNTVESLALRMQQAYYLGPHAKVAVDVELPAGVEEMCINKADCLGEIRLNLTQASGQQPVSFGTDVNVSFVGDASLSPGRHTYIIQTIEEEDGDVIVMLSEKDWRGALAGGEGDE